MLVWGGFSGPRFWAGVRLGERRGEAPKEFFFPFPARGGGGGGGGGWPGGPQATRLLEHPEHRGGRVVAFAAFVLGRFGDAVPGQHMRRTRAAAAGPAGAAEIRLLEHLVQGAAGAGAAGEGEEAAPGLRGRPRQRPGWILVLGDLGEGRRCRRAARLEKLVIRHGSKPCGQRGRQQRRHRRRLAAGRGRRRQRRLLVRHLRSAIASGDRRTRLSRSASHQSGALRSRRRGRAPRPPPPAPRRRPARAASGRRAAGKRARSPPPGGAGRAAPTRRGSGGGRGSAPRRAAGRPPSRSASACSWWRGRSGRPEVVDHPLRRPARGRAPAPGRPAGCATGRGRTPPRIRAPCFCAR